MGDVIQENICDRFIKQKIPFHWSETATGGVLCKKMFLENSQISQENTCARVSFLIKLQA